MNNQGQNVVRSLAGDGAPAVKMIGQGWAGKSAAGYVVSWQSRALDETTGTHPQRHLFFTDKAKAERTADVKRKLGLKKVSVEPRTVALKFSSLIPAT